MGGPLMFLKMLHCRKKCQQSARRRREHSLHRSASVTTSSSPVYTSKQTICRICLKEGDIPIYGMDGTDDIPEALATFGGIEIDEEDAYPKYLCHSCHALLQGAILFRKTAQQSEQLLKKPLKIKTDSDNGSNYSEEGNTYEFTVTVDNEEVESKTYHCKRCDINFETYNDYSEHRLSEEHENRRQTCPICQKSYTVLYFKKHLAIHKREEPLYMCDICGKNFIIQGHFKKHRLTHFYELPFKCSLCPYRGRFSESLKMHMRTHTGEKPYQCSQCSARFINKSNLNMHMHTHKGEHDYKCENCGRGFYTKRTLDLHIKVDHTGVKDHVCNICFKAFGYRKQMMKHQLKVHKRQKMRSGRTPLYLQVEKMADGQET